MRAVNSGPSSRKWGQSRDVGRASHLELHVAGLSCLLEPWGSQGPVPRMSKEELPSRDVEAACSPAASSFVSPNHLAPPGPAAGTPCCLALSPLS